MKKILLSCVTCLLALGLVTACDDEVEDVTPEDPNAGVVEPGGDDGDDGGSGDGGEVTTYLFGVEIDGVLSYVTGATQSQGAYRGVLSTDVSEAVAISCEVSDSTYYLSFDNEGVTNWITITSSGYTNLSYATEKSPIYLHTTDGGAEYFGNEDGSYFLGYNSTYDCLYASQVSQYIDSSPVAGLYTTDGKLVAGGKGEEPEPIPEPVGTREVVGTGVLGLYQGNKGAYYYITGEITTSGSNTFLEMTTSYSDAATVTIWKDDVYYYLTVGEGEGLKYIACPDTTKSSVALTSEPYCLQYDEEYEAWLTGNGVEFLATYGTYETMSWANVSRYLGDESEFIAHIYNEEQKLTAPSSEDITITGPDSVYIGSTITLTASVPLGYDSSFIWTSDNTGYATIEESSTGDTCVVTGASEGQTVITVTSAVNPEATATATIKVEPVPAGLIGSFDFSTNTENGTGISASTDLDDFYTGVSGAYLGIRDYDTVYLGNGSSGAFENVTTCIKFGTGSANGTLQLKFALGTSIEKVVVTAHSWNKDSNSNQLVINGVSQDCSTSGTAEELTYEIAGDLTYLLTFESVGRVTIHSIDIYGTTGNSYDPITSLTLTPDENELSIGESTHITVSWAPETTIFDIDTLGWSSSNEEVASVHSDLTGAVVISSGAGEATITAKANDTVSGSVVITIKAVESGVSMSQDITTETIMEAYPNYTIGSGSTPADSCYLATTSHSDVTTLGLVTATWKCDSGTGIRLWNDGIRFYNGSSVTIDVGSHSLTNIVFTAVNTASASSNPNDFATMSSNITGGTAVITDLSASGDGKVMTITPTDNASSITIALPSGASNTFVASIVVNFVTA